MLDFKMDFWERRSVWGIILSLCINNYYIVICLLLIQEWISKLLVKGWCFKSFMCFWRIHLEKIIFLMLLISQIHSIRAANLSCPSKEKTFTLCYWVHIDFDASVSEVVKNFNKHSELSEKSKRNIFQIFSHKSKFCIVWNCFIAKLTLISQKYFFGVIQNDNISNIVL